MPYKDNEKRLAYAREYGRRKWARIRLDPKLRKTHYGYRQGKRRAEHLKGRYGLTLEQWDALFKAQGRCCAICKATTSGWVRGWHTDHDHATDRVRGILCHGCNRLLGYVKDDVSRLHAYIEYLT